MRSSPWIRKLLLIPCGLMLALVLVEVGMRLTGFALMSSQRRSNQARAGDEAAIRILCLGESTSAEAYSDRGDLSWPKALERILNSSTKQRRYRIYNMAVPGLITSVIAADLNSQLAKYRPHLVVSMIGVNDRNLGTRYVSRHAPWHGLRIYKLARWLFQAYGGLPSPAPLEKLKHHSLPYFQQVQSNGEQIMKLLLRGDEAAAEARLFSLRRDESEIGAHVFSEVSTRADQNGRTLQGIEVLLRAYARGKPDFRLLQKITSFLAHGQETEGQERLSRRAVELFARDHESLRPGARLVSHFASIYSNLSAPVPAMERILKRHDIRKDRSTPHQNTVHNYRVIHRKLRRAGVRWIAMAYPLTDVSALRNIFSHQPLRRFSSFYDALQIRFPRLTIRPRYRDIVFVENLDNFKRALLSHRFEEIFSDRFGTIFGHTTDLGHRIIAENVAQVIRGSEL